MMYDDVTKNANYVILKERLESAVIWELFPKGCEVEDPTLNV